MAATWIVEAIDVFEDGHLSLAPCFPRMPPDQLRLDGFKERLNRRIIVAITFARHRYLEPMLAQDLLVVVRTVLAAAICVVNAALWWRPERGGHVQRPDRQVTFHPIADRPANDTA